jgi:hypothetical protein
MQRTDTHVALLTELRLAAPYPLAGVADWPSQSFRGGTSVAAN